MQRTWKYRLYPTAAQANELERQLALACDLYNATLKKRIWAWRHFGHRKQRTGR
jgi:transposase